MNCIILMTCFDDVTFINEAIESSYSGSVKFDLFVADGYITNSSLGTTSFEKMAC